MDVREAGSRGGKATWSQVRGKHKRSEVMKRVRKGGYVMPEVVMTPNALLRGAHLALQNAGEALNDGLLLYEHGRYTRAAFLALHALEELGRFTLLRDFAERAAAGKEITRGQVIRQCENHVEKVGRGMGSITFEAPPGGRLSRLAGESFGEALGLAPGQHEPLGGDAGVKVEHIPVAAEGFGKVLEAARRLAERIRKERLEGHLAMRAATLYVDPDESGTGWSYPTATPKEARSSLAIAANNYGVQALKFRPEFLRKAGKETEAKVLEAEQDLPPLPKLDSDAIEHMYLAHSLSRSRAGASLKSRKSQRTRG